MKKALAEPLKATEEINKTCIGTEQLTVVERQLQEKAPAEETLKLY